MGDGALAYAGHLRTAPAAIAAIADQISIESLGGYVAGHDGEVAPVDGMLTELLSEDALGLRGTSKDDKPAGVAVEPVDGTHSAAARSLSLQQTWYELVQRRLPGSFCTPCLVAPHGQAQGSDAGGLVYHDHVRIGVHDAHGIRRRTPRCRLGKQVHDLLRPQTTCRIRTYVAIYQYPSGSDESAYLRPAAPRQPMPEQGRQRLPDLSGFHTEHLSLQCHDVPVVLVAIAPVEGDGPSSPYRNNRQAPLTKHMSATLKIGQSKRLLAQSCGSVR